MAHVLVTGGCGFIGRHLVDTLARRGDEVRVLDVAEPRQPVAGVEYVRGSVDDAASFGVALNGAARVYHLAGIAHFWRADPQDFDRVNRRGTEVVLKTAAARGVERVVHCSTESILLPKRRNGSAVNESATPALEDMPGPYTRSKYLGERVALEAARNGMDVVVVNPTVPVGDGDPNMTPPSAMLSLFLTGGSRFFLDCILNLADVRDLAEGIVQAGDRGRAGERYILGGENFALRDLLKVLERKSGRPMPTRTVPAALALATGFVAGLIADKVTGAAPVVTSEAVQVALRSAPFDSAKAKHELGYAPRPVDQALSEFVAAFEQRDGKRRAQHGKVRVLTK